MTLSMAFKCKDGVVVASDSQATGNSTGGAVRWTVRKISQVGRNSLFTASGAISMIQCGLDVFREYDADLDRGLSPVLQKELKRRIVDIGAEARDLHKSYHGSVEDAPSVDIILSNTAHQIWHLSKDGNAEFVQDVGYYCVGNGDTFGYSTLRRVPLQQFSIESGKVLAYGIIKDAIEVSAFGVGGAIDIWTIGTEPRRANASEVAAIAHTSARIQQQALNLIKSCSIRG